MRVKALESFGGRINMRQGEERELEDVELIRDLAKAGYIEKVGSLKEPASEPEAEEMQPEPETEEVQPEPEAEMQQEPEKEQPEPEVSNSDTGKRKRKKAEKDSENK